MNNYENNLWGHTLKKFKILKIKTFRSTHRLKQVVKTSGLAKKMLLLATFNTTVAAAPEVKNIYAKDTDRIIPTKEWVYPRTQKDSVERFAFHYKDSITARQSHFAKDLWEILNDNVKTVQQGTANGKKTQTLKKLFGNDVNPKYYCAISGLRSLEQTIKEKNYPEYEFLLNCINNPHACMSVIEGLEKNFGKNSATNNIREQLSSTLKQNPNAVHIAIVNTTQNSNSGKHFVFVLPNKVLLENSIEEVDTLKGKVISFNVDNIVNSDRYFKGSRNTGYLFNITAMSEKDLVMLFYNKYAKSSYPNFYRTIPPTKITSGKNSKSRKKSDKQIKLQISNFQQHPHS